MPLAAVAGPPLGDRLLALVGPREGRGGARRSASPLVLPAREAERSRGGGRALEGIGSSLVVVDPLVMAPALFPAPPPFVLARLVGKILAYALGGETGPAPGTGPRRGEAG